VIEPSGDPAAWAAGLLRDQLMPAQEIEALLEAGDPAQIRRRLELHAERLQERLVDQLRTLSRLERELVAELERAGSKAPALSAAGIR
jgi:hypothetical protein